MSLLPWLLVALGLVLLLAAWAVWHRGRRISRCIAQLLALPADMHPLRWPDRARPVLQQAGIAGLHWQGQWFGDAVQGQWGEPPAPNWPSQTLEAGPDCQILLRWADVARTQAWLVGLPWIGADLQKALQGASAQGAAQLTARWTGGWRRPRGC